MPEAARDRFGHNSPVGGELQHLADEQHRIGGHDRHERRAEDGRERQYERREHETILETYLHALGMLE